MVVSPAGQEALMRVQRHRASASMKAWMPPLVIDSSLAGHDG
jgi:hypothetical protein